MSTVYYVGPYEPSRGYSSGALVQFGGHTYICTAPVAAAHRYAHDDFTGRRVQGGWGRASDGHALWTVGAENTTSRLRNFSVSHGLGLLTYGADGILAHAGGDSGPFWIMFGATQSGAVRDLVVRYRYTKEMEPGWLTEWALQADAGWSNSAPDVEIDNDRTFLWVYNGGSDNANAARDPVLVANVWYDTRLRCNPPLFSARTWATGTPEPETWDVAVSDAFTITPGAVLLNPRWTGMPANQVIQHSYVAVLSVNPTPDLDTSHFDQIA